MNWFPAKRRAFRTLLLTVAATIPCYCAGFPMPLALAIGYLFSATLTYARGWS